MLFITWLYKFLQRKVLIKMKTKKILSVLAAMSIIGTMGVTVSAADWSETSYADNDPEIVKIVSTDANSIVFTNTASQTDICKARITLEKVLKNPADYAKIAKMTWKVTYNNVSSDYKGDALSGGTYVTNANSVGYKIEPDSFNENDEPVWSKSTYETTDEFNAETTCIENGEIVFMDWSYADIGGSGITVTISDFKIFDADGNEIEQLGYGEFATLGQTEAEPAETEPEHKPGDDNIESVPNAPTGNIGVSIAAVTSALAAAGLIATKKRK